MIRLTLEDTDAQAVITITDRHDLNERTWVWILKNMVVPALSALTYGGVPQRIGIRQGWSKELPDAYINLEDVDDE